MTLTTILSVPLKRCSKKEQCVHPEQKDGGWLPATKEYFHRHKHTKDGFAERCKRCRSSEGKQYREDNREHVLKLKQEDYQLHRDDYISRKHQSRLADPERSRAINRRSYNLHQPKYTEAKRSYRRSNLELVREQDRRSHLRHRSKRNDRNRCYRLSHLEQLRQATRIYRQAHPGQGRAASQRYRARKRGLPNTFTHMDWQRALDYFNGCCAVCGRQLDDLFGTHTAHADHWQPISLPDCPGTVSTNIIPLCGGISGCNNSKADRLPESWLRSRFGKVRTIEILTRINTYFEWVKSQGG